MYYAPPPPPPAPVDPYAGAAYAGGGGYAAPVDPGFQEPPPLETGPNSGGAERPDSESGGDSNTLITILPFGAGQFQNGATMLGIGFLVGQLGALYYWNSKNSVAESTAAETNKITGTADTSQMSDEEQAQFATFVAERIAYVEDQRSKAQLGLFGFLGLWGLGVIEAMVNEPAPKKNKVRKRRKYGGLDSLGSPQYHLLPVEESQKMVAFDWNVQVAPRVVLVPGYETPNILDSSPAMIDYKPMEIAPSINLGVNWTF